MDSKNKEIVDDENKANDRIIGGVIKHDDRTVNWGKVSADFMSKIKDTYIACKVNGFIFEKCAGKLSLEFNDVSNLILSIATYYDNKINYYQEHVAMLNTLKSAGSGFDRTGMNPMMGGMSMGMNPMGSLGMGPMMGRTMNCMDKNVMTGMNPVMSGISSITGHDVIETLNFLATTSKEISSLNEDISKNLKDKLNVITEDIYKAIQIADEDKINKETK